jgi:hypothetical protein
MFVNPVCVHAEIAMKKLHAGSKGLKNVTQKKINFFYDAALILLKFMLLLRYPQKYIAKRQQKLTCWEHYALLCDERKLISGIRCRGHQL